jgi:Ni,Fe-hydrogenase III small subunit
MMTCAEGSVLNGMKIRPIEKECPPSVVIPSCAGMPAEICVNFRIYLDKSSLPLLFNAYAPDLYHRGSEWGGEDDLRA